jgi:hypothetical protein
MIITLSCVVSLSFLFYVVVFGGSSTGLIGRLHRTITRCSCFTLCCGDRCGRGLQRTEEVCCLRPNPALQLFYLGLVFSGLALFMYSSFPFVANPRLAEWHTYSPYPAVSAGLLSFFLACYCDPGTISAASLHRFSREPFDGVIYKPKMCPTCLIPRPARSKHCVICNRCVAKFDHHCPWINTCVGEALCPHAQHRARKVLFLRGALPSPSFVLERGRPAVQFCFRLDPGLPASFLLDWGRPPACTTGEDRTPGALPGRLCRPPATYLSRPASSQLFFQCGAPRAGEF